MPPLRTVDRQGQRGPVARGQARGHRAHRDSVMAVDRARGHLDRRAGGGAAAAQPQRDPLAGHRGVTDRGQLDRGGGTRGRRRAGAVGRRPGPRRARIIPGSSPTPPTSSSTPSSWPSGSSATPRPSARRTSSRVLAAASAGALTRRSPGQAWLAGGGRPAGVPHAGYDARRRRLEPRNPTHTSKSAAPRTVALAPITERGARRLRHFAAPSINRWMRMDNQPADLHANQGARRRARARALGSELTVPLGVIAIGVLVLIFDGHEVSWLAGVIAGGGAGAWVALRRGGARPRPRRRSGRRAARRAPDRRRARAAAWRRMALPARRSRARHHL